MSPQKPSASERTMPIPGVQPLGPLDDETLELRNKLSIARAALFTVTVRWVVTREVHDFIVQALSESDPGGEDPK